MVKINELTLKLVNEIIEKSAILGADVNKLNTGQTVINLTICSEHLKLSSFSIFISFPAFI